jgi:hypothetical protein
MRHDSRGGATKEQQCPSPPGERNAGNRMAPPRQSAARPAAISCPLHCVVAATGSTSTSASTASTTSGATVLHHGPSQKAGQDLVLRTSEVVMSSGASKHLHLHVRDR